MPLQPVTGADFRVVPGPGLYPYGDFVIPGSLHATFWRFGVVIELQATVLDGRPIITDVALHRQEGDGATHGLTTSDVRRLALDRLLREAVLAVARVTESGDEASLRGRPADAGDADRLARLVAQRQESGEWKLTPDFLDEVVRVYRNAPDQARVLAVVDHFSKLQPKPVPRPTASRWVQTARKRGYFEGGPVEQCERCNARIRGAHHVVDEAEPIEILGVTAGSSITQTFCSEHCSGDCDKEH